MGKRIRAQRKGSSPRYRVASHRFPGANRMPRVSDVVGEITELVHSPVHSAPLARMKLPDGETTLVVATEGLAIGSAVVIGYVLGPAALGGTLAGATTTGVLMALFMANAGGAWDNAKKAIEQVLHSDATAAADAQDPELVARAAVEELVHSDPEQVSAILSRWALEQPQAAAPQQ